MKNIQQSSSKPLRRDSSLTMIVGCGRLGALLADTLSDQGDSVIIIDRDPGSFRKLPTTYGGQTLSGDGESYDVLEEAGVQRASHLLAVTDSDNANIMISEIAHSVYGVPHILARLADPELAEDFAGDGIETICPAELSAMAILQTLQVDPQAIQHSVERSVR